jgi:hypothetical protein
VEDVVPGWFCATVAHGELETELIVLWCYRNHWAYCLAMFLPYWALIPEVVSHIKHYHQNFGTKSNDCQISDNLQCFGKALWARRSQRYEKSKPNIQFGLLYVIMLILVEYQPICEGKHGNVTLLQK